MKKFLLAFLATAALVSSCEKRYFQPTKTPSVTKRRAPDNPNGKRPDRVQPIVIKRP
jgi:hypothetical protein